MDRSSLGEPPTASAPAIGVVIPTHNRPDLLGDCLASLAAQDLSQGVLEVVVVDDDSDVDLGPLVAASATDAVPVRLVRQSRRGANADRNLGAATTSAKVLAFLDDDVLVSPGWAAAVHDALTHGLCSALAGRIQLRLEAPAPRWLAHPDLRTRLSELDLGPTPLPLPAWLTPFSANCAVTRATFDTVGGFPVPGDQAPDEAVNDEIVFFRRVRQAGATIRYEPRAHVQHRVPASRLTKAWFERRYFAQGVADVLLLETVPRRPLLSLAREGLRATRAGPILGQGLVAGRGPANARFWLAYCRGRAAGVRRTARRGVGGSGPRQ
jgi:glycosyltransferase involved in cell wall biosynthesis